MKPRFFRIFVLFSFLIGTVLFTSNRMPSLQAHPDTLELLVNGLLIPPTSTNQTVTVSANSFIKRPMKDQTISAVNGDIAFSSNRQGSFSIFSQQPTQPEAALLVTSSANDSTPVWSPNGAEVVFASDRDGDYEIYVRKSDGNIQQLTHNNTHDFHPSWSPDGQRILFSSERNGNYYQAYSMAPDGSNVHQIASIASHVFYPRYSPDGNRIAYMRASVTDVVCDWNWDVWVMNIDGSNQRRITSQLGADVYPNWTPDGRIIYASCRNFFDSDLFIVNPDTGSEIQLNSWFGSHELNAVFSPEADFLAFNTTADGNYEIYFVSSAGGYANNMTQHVATDIAPSWGTQNVGVTLAPYITTFIENSQKDIGRIADGAGDVALVGDYFLDKQSNDAARFIVDAGFNAFNLVGVNWGRVGRGLQKISAPGHYKAALHASWRYWADDKVAKHWYKRLYDKVHNNRELLFRETALAGIKYWALQFGEEISQDQLPIWLDKWLKPGVGNPIQVVAGNPTIELGNLYQAEFEIAQDDLLAQLSSLNLTSEQVEMYALDLTARQQANFLLTKQLEQYHDILWDGYQSALSDDDSWYQGWSWTLVEWGVIAAATLAYDGPGYYVASAGMSAIDLIKDGVLDARAMNQDGKMLDQALKFLSNRTFYAYDQIAMNTRNALNLVEAGDVPEIARGQVNIQSLQSIGHYRFFISPWWAEERSQIVLTVANTESFPTTFRTTADYTRNGWWNGEQVFIVEGKSIDLSGYQSGQIIVPLKMDEDGVSPSDNSPVNILVIGDSDTGFYPIATLTDLWAPDKVESFSVRMTPLSPDMRSQLETEEDIPTYPYPLSFFVYTMPETTEHQLNINVYNSFDVPVKAIVQQTIPDGFTIIDANEGVEANGDLQWETTIPAKTAWIIQATVHWDGNLGERILINSPELRLTDEAATVSDTFVTEDVVIEAPWPLSSVSNIPMTWQNGQESIISTNLTNVSPTIAINGTMQLQVQTLTGLVLWQRSIDFHLASNQTKSYSVPTSINTTEELLVVKGTATINGIEKTIFQELVSIEARKVYLPVIKN